MRMAFIIASCVSILAALLACEPRPRPGITEGEDARVEAVLAEARELEADRYAPGLYADAVEALEKGEVSDASLQDAGSAELAGRALDEAVRVREEAKLAADQQIRTARILFTVVEAVLSHHPPNRYTLPSDRELAELRGDLARAQDAYQAGDFAEAGHIAQGVTSALAGSET